MASKVQAAHKETLERVGYVQVSETGSFVVMQHEKSPGPKIFLGRRGAVLIGKTFTAAQKMSRGMLRRLFPSLYVDPIVPGKNR